MRSMTITFLAGDRHMEGSIAHTFEACSTLENPGKFVLMQTRKNLDDETHVPDVVLMTLQKGHAVPFALAANEDVTYCDALNGDVPMHYPLATREQTDAFLTLRLNIPNVARS